MNTKKQATSTFLAITTVLAAGVLTGCKYCEPLLMAALVTGVIYKGLTYSPFAEATSAGTKHLNQKF
jgi:hypothetical protein